MPVCMDPNQSDKNLSLLDTLVFTIQLLSFISGSYSVAVLLKHLLEKIKIQETPDHLCTHRSITNKGIAVFISNL